MTASDVDLLARAHDLFTGAAHRTLPGGPSPTPEGTELTGLTASAHRHAAQTSRLRMQAAADVDAELARILVAARQAHADANRDTGAVLAAARADAAALPDSPIAARELLHRRVARLRAQHAHVLAARRRAHRGRRNLRALRYRTSRRRGRAGRSRADAAVRAALSRLGSPYVWGATGPDRFDCSGLVQWAYAQAGIPLHRTTYQQIYDGVPVLPSRVRPGDLVFPHTGHVQMAIGGGLVVEAPQPGATVQISRMGPAVAIRRPLSQG